MKNLKFISGLFLGIFLGVFLIILITCKSESPTPVQQVPDSFTQINGLNNYAGEVYKLTIDNVKYIVVSNGSDGGIAIIKHQ